MPPIRPSAELRQEALRAQQAEVLSKKETKQALQAEIEANEATSKKARRLFKALKKAGLAGVWLDDPNRDSDYPDQTVSYKMKRKARHPGALWKDLLISTTVASDLPEGGSAPAAYREHIVVLDAGSMEHGIGKTEELSQTGVTIWPELNSTHMEGVALAPVRRDVEDTLAVIEAAAVAKGMKPLTKPDMVVRVGAAETGRPLQPTVIVADHPI